MEETQFMGTDQVTGLVRAALAAGVAYVAGKGWIPAGTLNDIAAGLTTILVAIWSWKANVPGKTNG
jgi:hypothetical protein